MIHIATVIKERNNARIEDPQNRLSSPEKRLMVMRMAARHFKDFEIADQAKAAVCDDGVLQLVDYPDRTEVYVNEEAFNQHNQGE